MPIEVPLLQSTIRVTPPMTDTSSTDSTSERAEDDLPAPAGDGLLQSFIGLANDGLGFGMTFQVGGMLVSGQLCGGKEYFGGLAADVASGFADPDAGEAARLGFVKLGEALYDIRPEGPARRPRENFIHLKDARFFIPGAQAMPGNRGVWWRGRISEISAFMLGTLSSAE